MENKYSYHYVFGPVLSRRLGRSLGVDVIPFKTCTYDCVYCQLGETTHKTIHQAEYVPLATVLEEIRRKFAEGCHADYVSIAGSGEPTLYQPLAALIEGIKSITNTPIAIITNGSLFWRPEVRDAITKADLLIPSLDAATPNSFQRVNRPAPEITFGRMIEGLTLLRESFSGAIWLEVFLVGPLAATDTEVTHLQTLIDQIRPDRIQLNTVARPTPGSNVIPVSLETLQAIATRLGPRAEVIAHIGPLAQETADTITPEEALAVIRRHPTTAEDLATGLGISRDGADRAIAFLLEKKKIAPMETSGAIFYIAVNPTL